MAIGKTIKWVGIGVIAYLAYKWYQGRKKPSGTIQMQPKTKMTAEKDALIRQKLATGYKEGYVQSDINTLRANIQSRNV